MDSSQITVVEQQKKDKKFNKMLLAAKRKTEQRKAERAAHRGKNSRNK